MDAVLEKSAKYTGIDGALSTLAVLTAITKRTEQFKDEKEKQKNCKSREEVEEWISKLQGQNLSIEEEIKSLEADQKRFQSEIERIDSEIKSKQAELNKHIEAEDSDQNMHFFLLNQITRLKNDRKSETSGLESLKTRIKDRKDDKKENESNLKSMEKQLIAVASHIPSDPISHATTVKEVSDVFGVWPSPMTGGKDEWHQFQSLFRSEISAIFDTLGREGGSHFEIASVLRTAVRILDGRRKLEQWKAAREKHLSRDRFEADPKGCPDLKEYIKKHKSELTAHLRDCMPEELKV